MTAIKVALSAAAGALLGGVLAWLVIGQGLGPDFGVIWAAQHVSDPYDPAAVKHAVEELFGSLPTQLAWPFPYPPTFLLLSAWLGAIPFTSAFVAWSAVSGGALAASARHPLGPLLVLSPWVVFAVMGGQTSVMVAALAYAGLQWNRPYAAGVLLGFAACIKPQLVAFIPVGLMFGGRWRSLATMGATGAVLCAASLVVYGSGIWVGWLASLPRIAELSSGINPHLDLPHWSLKALVLPAGLWLIWRTYRCGTPAEQLVSAAGTALLVMPHSLWYNAALLAPAALSMRARVRPTVAVLLLLFRPSTWTTILMMALVAPARPPKARPGGED